MRIRIAMPNDFEAIVTIDHVAKNSSARIESIGKWIEDQQCYVAVIDGEVLGYAVLNYEFFHFGNVEMLMISPSARKKGIGRQLIRHLEMECKTKKFWATTNQSNQPMQELLKSEGFVFSGSIDNLDPGDPELVFF